MSDRRSWNVLLSHSDVRYPEKVECQLDRIPPLVEWAMLQGGPSACARCRDPSPWWHGAHIAIRSNSIRIPQEDMWRASLSKLPQGEAHDTREHHTRMIAYPIRICCPDHWLPPPSDGVSGRPVRTSFCSLHSGSAYGKGLQSFGSSCFWAFHCFAMDSKELSSFSDCFGDQKAIKTPKLNTIWLE